MSGAAHVVWMRHRSHQWVQEKGRRTSGLLQHARYATKRKSYSCVARNGIAPFNAANQASCETEKHNGSDDGSWWDKSREIRSTKRQRSIHEIIERLEPKLMLGGLRVVLVEPKYSGNVGSAARACANFECIDLVVVNPRCTPNDEEAYKLAAGETFVLHRLKVVSSLDAALEGTYGSIAFTRRHGKERPVYRSLQHLYSMFPDYVINTETSDKAPAQIAFVFGREDSGLTDKEVMRCQLASMIPTGRLKESLNLSVAVTLVLSQFYDIVVRSQHENKKESCDGQNTDTARSDDKSFEALIRNVDSLMESVSSVLSHDSSFAHYKNRQLLRMLKLVFARSSITRDEVNALHGLIASLQEVVDKASSKDQHNQSHSESDGGFGSEDD